jgi:phenylacetic acid degradation operon negative regulatory protein
VTSTAGGVTTPLTDRLESRRSARSFLLTVLGELVWPAGSPARTTSLLAVMSGLGFEEAAVRQAIVRASEKGWITGHRHGREVSWTLTPRLEEAFRDGSRLVHALGERFDDWDGQWLVLLVTVPQARRSARKRLYRDLSWVGLGNPAPGVWLSPHSDRVDDVAGVIDRLGLRESAFSFIGATAAVGLSEDQIVRRGWDLDALAADYAEVADRFRDPRPSAGEQMLLEHVRMMNELQRFPFADPQLPEALIPEWPGRAVVRHLEELRAQWGPLVRKQWMSLNAGRVAAPGSPPADGG